MEKPATTPHMPCKRHMLAHTAHETFAFRATRPTRATRATRVIPCRVDPLAPHQPGARRPAGGMAEAPTASRRAAGRADRRQVWTGCRAAAGTGARGMRSTRGGELRPPIREARRGREAVTRAPYCRRIGKGHGAYFAADGTRGRGLNGIARLSQCESPSYAQDLQTATLCNKTTT